MFRGIVHDSRKKAAYRAFITIENRRVRAQDRQGYADIGQGCLEHWPNGFQKLGQINQLLIRLPGIFLAHRDLVKLPY